MPSGLPADDLSALPREATLTRPSEVRDLLATLCIVPRKSLGQNFLIDRNVLDIIVEAAELRDSDRVLEIGAGLGVLTERLAASAARVVAVEKDPALFAYLGRRFGAAARVELVRADALELDLAALLAPGPTKAVANLPYSVGNRILVNLTRCARPPDRIVVTTQYEVAQRLSAAPGTHDYSLLSVWVQALYRAAIRKKISPTCFFPAPSVHSAVVTLERLEQPAAPPPLADGFYRLTKCAFGRRRKQLPNALSGAVLPPERLLDALRSLGLSPASRPGDLSAAQWVHLAFECEAAPHPPA